jgi:hypothetical protein
LPAPEDSQPPLVGATRHVERTGDATGQVTYRWLPGRYFLVQEGQLSLFGHQNVFTEVIGRLRPFGGEPSHDIASRVYTSEGDTLDYVYELNGDTLTICGGSRGSDSRYIGTFSTDGTTLTGAWSWPGGGYQTTTTREPDPAT